MALGKFNFAATVREHKIQRLDDELKLIDLYKGDLPSEIEGNEAEGYFRAWVKGRHGHRVLRAGWPDFLLVHATTGKPFGVEVKTGRDKLSKSQARCFSVLEKSGIPVYVWKPEQPKALIPWCIFLKNSGRYRDGDFEKGNGIKEP